MANDQAMVQVKEYSITSSPEAIKEALRENLGGQEITAFDLDRIKIPAGGGTSWEVPTLDGEEAMKEVKGVIVHWQDKRVYWAESIEDTGGGAPPDCYSEDSITGRGNPGGACDECPFAEFESANKGKGQACKQLRILYMIRSTDLLPLVVSLPPTSLKPSRKFFLRLASKGVSYYAVETTLGLEKIKSEGGIEYSRVTFGVSRRLDKDTLEKVKRYIAEIKPALQQVRVDGQDLDDSE